MRSSLRDILGDLPTSGDQVRQISLLDDLHQQSGRQLGGGGSGIRLRILDDEDDYYASCRGGRRGPPPELDLKMCAEVLGTESGEFMVDFPLWPAAEAAADDGDRSRSRISSSGSVIRTKLRSETSMMMELKKELPPMLPLLSTNGRHGRWRLNRKTTGDGRLVICSDFDSDRKDGEDKDLGQMPPLMSTLDWDGRRRLVSKRATMSDGRLLVKMEQSLELDEEEKRRS